MKHLWLFYPENDIALAHDLANFTAPPAAVKLRLAGEMLPLWMAASGDAILCSGVDAKWLGNIQQQFGIEAGPWDHDAGDVCPTPWGWSKAARKFFLENGVSADALPDDDTLSRYRQLSHRRTAAALSRALQEHLPFTIWPAATEVGNIEQLEAELANHSSAVVKSPWSSSGRGVLFANTDNREQVMRQAAGMIRRQGSVMVERCARRLTDFAMLFNMSCGECLTAGLSLFLTDRNGSYCGNFVGSQEEIANRISSYIPREKLDAIAKALPSILQDLLSGYEGPVGVDMLVAEDDDGAIIHPAVEINLRYTMGFVALALEKYVAAPAIFKVVTGNQSRNCHPIIQQRRLIGGSMALTPPTGDFSFILEIS